MSTASPSAVITADQFDQMDFEAPVELVRGEIREMPRPGAVHGRVCALVAFELETWSRQLRCGHVVSNDSGVITERDPDTVRGPDVYYIRKERLPDGRLPEGSLSVPPDLAIEVLSPFDRWRDVNEKVYESLVSGVGEVWIIDPAGKTVRVFPADGPPVTFLESDELASPQLLAGFACRVAALFPGEDATGPTSPGSQ